MLLYLLIPTFLHAHTIPAPITQNPKPILTASFTWNNNCGPTVACGPSFAGIHGIGATAANDLTYSLSLPIINGRGAACGQCWHLTPLINVFPNLGKTFGTSVIAKITDQCTDGGYCDQTEQRPLNTGYGQQVHFDLCAATGAAGQFFGGMGPGVLTGVARLEPNCDRLQDGAFGSGAGDDGGGGSSNGIRGTSSGASASPASVYSGPASSVAVQNIAAPSDQTQSIAGNGGSLVGPLYTNRTSGKVPLHVPVGQNIQDFQAQGWGSDQECRA